jgi:hypothetical protein
MRKEDWIVRPRLLPQLLFTTLAAAAVAGVVYMAADVRIDWSSWQGFGTPSNEIALRHIEEITAGQRGAR